LPDSRIHIRGNVWRKKASDVVQMHYSLMEAQILDQADQSSSTVERKICPKAMLLHVTDLEHRRRREARGEGALIAEPPGPRGDSVWRGSRGVSARRWACFGARAPNSEWPRGERTPIPLQARARRARLRRLSRSAETVDAAVQFADGGDLRDRFRHRSETHRFPSGRSRSGSRRRSKVFARAVTRWSALL
ncbi:hypothetical protein P4O66_007202, partial [Electrophorus voltai]